MAEPAASLSLELEALPSVSNLEAARSLSSAALEAGDERFGSTELFDIEILGLVTMASKGADSGATLRGESMKVERRPPKRLSSREPKSESKGENMEGTRRSPKAATEDVADGDATDRSLSTRGLKALKAGSTVSVDSLSWLGAPLLLPPVAPCSRLL